MTRSDIRKFSHMPHLIAVFIHVAHSRHVAVTRHADVVGEQTASVRPVPERDARVTLPPRRAAPTLDTHPAAAQVSGVGARVNGPVVDAPVSVAVALTDAARERAQLVTHAERLVVVQRRTALTL